MTGRMFIAAATAMVLASGTALAQGFPGEGGPQGPGGPGGQGGRPGGRGGFGQGPGGGGGFGQGPGGRGGFGQGPGGRGGMMGMPFAIGTITGGDLNSGTITIQSQFGGQAQQVKVNSNTKVVTQQQATVADLKVGDKVQVQGMPTGISAQNLTIGDTPDFLANPFGGGRPGGAPGVGAGNAGAPAGAPNPFGGGGAGGPQGGPGGPPQGGPGGGFGRPQQNAMAMANGKVTNLNPLTIEVTPEISVVLKLAPNAKITKFVATPLNKLKVGDRIMATGQAGQDGSFNANGIGVNFEGGMGGMMGGMMGGRGFGGPGFGGPGGPGGPGGFGGPGGGPGGGAGGPGVPPPPPGDPNSQAR